MFYKIGSDRQNKQTDRKKINTWILYLQKQTHRHIDRPTDRHIDRKEKTYRRDPNPLILALNPNPPYPPLNITPDPSPDLTLTINESEPLTRTPPELGPEPSFPSPD